VITRSADSQLQHVYDIDADSNIPATTLKGTHTYGNIKQLLEGSQYAESFARGTFIHYFLTPYDYHRLHLPVGGLVKESFVIQGKVVQRIDLQDHQLAVQDSTLTGYEFRQTRGVVTIDTTDSEGGNIGIVAVIPVGMWQVASVVLTAVQGKQMAKGEEFGYFQFGGSETIVLLQEGLDVQVDADESHRRVGEFAARCSPLGS
jgi:phosphatidylserine decarboxylase